jgi:hypothetical protein
MWKVKAVEAWLKTFSGLVVTGSFGLSCNGSKVSVPETGSPATIPNCANIPAVAVAVPL